MSKPIRKKPFDPKLPGKYGRMTQAELSAASDRYDVPHTAMDEAAATRQSPRSHHPAKRQGRPPKPAGTTARRVLISVEPSLLRAADAYVKRTGGTRAGWIQQLMRTALRSKSA